MEDTKTADVLVVDEGTIFRFIPQTDVAREWLEEHTDGMWFGPALIVEHRFAADLADGLTQDGLRVQ